MTLSTGNIPEFTGQFNRREMKKISLLTAIVLMILLTIHFACKPEFFG
jgi:hypothetical protein